MSESESSLQRFFHELRRRRVFRVTAVYAVAGWAVFEVVQGVTEPLFLPPWTTRLVLILELLGFPFALGLAWAFDLTSEGIQRTQARADGLPLSPTHSRTAGRLAVVGAVAVLALAGAAMLFTGSDEASAVVENRVAVLPFENRTGDPELDELGVVAADWINDGLAAIDTLQVVPTAEVREIVAAAGRGSNPLPRVAQKSQAGLAIVGSYLLIGDSVEVRGQLVDPAGGRVLASLRPARSQRSTPTAAFATIRQQAMGAVAARLGELPGMSATVMQRTPPSYEAYRAYLAGVELYFAVRYPEAIREMDRAVAIDPDFIAPRVWIFASLVYMRELARADTVLRLIEQHRADISEPGRLMLDTFRSYLRGDLPGAYRSALAWLDRAPGNLERLTAGTFAGLANRPGETVQLLDAVPPESRRQIGAGYFDLLGRALYILGEYHRELEVARQYREAMPDWRSAILQEARALAALDRPEEAEALLDDLLMLPPRTTTAPRVVLQLGDALAAHGHATAARRIYQRGLDLLEKEGAPETPPELLERAQMLRRLGKLREAAWYAGAAHAAVPDHPEALALVGIIAAQQGDRAHAEQVAADLAGARDPYFGVNTFRLACIRARLGDLDAAVERLRQANAQGWGLNNMDRLNPDLAPLDGYPAFESLMRPRG